MKKERLQELAGIELQVEEVKTTKENPLVFIWSDATSKGFPEQGIIGHMNLSVAANIHKFDTTGLADQLVKAGPGSGEFGKGPRIKAGKIYLSYSKWNKKELKELKENDKNILRRRINILLKQIDDAKASGKKYNLLGMPMDGQIESWEEEINKAKEQLKR